MREIIVLRHANAEPASPGQPDHERVLSAHGEIEAKATARWLLDHGYRPDRILCSPARRTCQTLEHVTAAIGPCDVRQEPAIYNATPGSLFALLDAHADAACVLLVGHNPGCEQLVALVNSGQSGDFRGMPTAGVAVLQLPPGTTLEPGAGRLHAFWWP